MNAGQGFVEKGQLRRSYSPDCGTAFTRPQPSAHKDVQCGYPEEGQKANVFANIPVSTVKHYQTMGAASYDRHTYIAPQYAITSSYGDYVSSNSSFCSQRIQGCGAPPSQSLCSFNSTMSPSCGSYCQESLTQPSVYEPHGTYNYNTFTSSYETLDKSPILRPGSYQETWPSRGSAFDTTRGYYRNTHDSFQGQYAPVNQAYVPARMSQTTFLTFHS